MRVACKANPSKTERWYVVQVTQNGQKSVEKRLGAICWDCGTHAETVYPDIGNPKEVLEKTNSDAQFESDFAKSMAHLMGPRSRVIL